MATPKPIPLSEIKVTEPGTTEEHRQRLADCLAAIRAGNYRAHTAASRNQPYALELEPLRPDGTFLFSFVKRKVSNLAPDAQAHAEHLEDLLFQGKRFPAPKTPAEIKARTAVIARYILPRENRKERALADAVLSPQECQEIRKDFQHFAERYRYPLPGDDRLPAQFVSKGTHHNPTVKVIKGSGNCQYAAANAPKEEAAKAVKSASKNASKGDSKHRKPASKDASSSSPSATATATS